MRCVLALMMVFAAASLAGDEPPEETDTAVRIFTGPVFWTGDPTAPEAAAIAVDRDGRILEIYGETPRDTPWEIVRLPGALALPGLHDAHMHVSGLGKLREQVMLMDARSAAEAAALTAKWAAEHPEAQVIRGRGWDQSRWPGGAFPTWGDLEGVSDRPVCLRRVDGHAAWLNRAMLDLAGIARGAVDPDGGRILRDAAG
ncbi:amidohydrolase family protein, partial [bacterium]|nr:amidohydrolase family protein [bacterium]